MSSTECIEDRVVAKAAKLRNSIEVLVKAISSVIHASQASGGDVCIIGIQTGGVHVTNRILTRLHSMGFPRPPVGILDITLYRDDTFMSLAQPLVRQTDIPFTLTGKDVILVDDVLFTGRTIRAALDALVDFGRPKSIRLAVVVDRGLREYPIQADWIGMKTLAQPDETVQVELTEMGCPKDRVVIYKRQA